MSFYEYCCISYHHTLLQLVLLLIQHHILRTYSPTIKSTQHPLLPDETHTPTGTPSKYPSNNPTTSQTTDPSKIPTIVPSNIPTSNPTEIPSTIPSNSPTNNPSSQPTEYPSNSPTQNPLLPVKHIHLLVHYHNHLLIILPITLQTILHKFQVLYLHVIRQLPQLHIQLYNQRIIHLTILHLIPQLIHRKLLQ